MVYLRDHANMVKICRYVLYLDFDCRDSLKPHRKTISACMTWKCFASWHTMIVTARTLEHRNARKNTHEEMSRYNTEACFALHLPGMHAQQTILVTCCHTQMHVHLAKAQRTSRRRGKHHSCCKAGV